MLLEVVPRLLEGLRKATEHSRHDTLPPSRGLRRKCSSHCRNVRPRHRPRSEVRPIAPKISVRPLRFLDLTLSRPALRRLRTEVTPRQSIKFATFSLHLALLLLLWSSSDNCVLPDYACRLLRRSSFNVLAGGSSMLEAVSP